MARYVCGDCGAHVTASNWDEARAKHECFNHDDFDQWAKEVRHANHKRKVSIGMMCLSVLLLIENTYFFSKALCEQSPYACLSLLVVALWMKILYDENEKRIEWTNLINSGQM